MLDIEKEEVGKVLGTLFETEAEVVLWCVGLGVVDEITLNGVAGEVVKSRPLVRLKNLLRWPIRLRAFQGFVGREIGFSLLVATFGAI